MKRTLKWGFFRKAAEVQRTLAFFVSVRNLRIIWGQRKNLRDLLFRHKF